MTGGRPPRTDEDLLRAFQQLFDEIGPDSPEEVDAVLRELGYEPSEISKRVKAAAQIAIAASPLNWRHQALDQLIKARARLREYTSGRAELTRGEMLAALERVTTGAESPHHRAVAAYFRSLDQASDEDLASLLGEIEYLNQHSLRANAKHEESK